MITGCGPVAVGAHEEAVDALAVRVRRTTRSRTARPRGRAGPSASSSGADDPTASSRAGCSPLWPRYQTAPSGRTPAAVIEPGSVSSARHDAGREVVPVEPVTPRLEQRAAAARTPSGHQSDGLHRARAGRAARSVTSPVRASHSAGRRSPVRSWVIAMRRSPGDRREAEAGELEARVPELGEGLARQRRPPTRSDGCRTSPSSMTSSTTTASSADSAAAVHGPRHPGPAREPDRLRVRVEQRARAAVVRDPDREARPRC